MGGNAGCVSVRKYMGESSGSEAMFGTKKIAK
jgi:hypothetical protein